MTAVVTATGNQTFFGRTAKLVASAGSKSHSEQAVLQIGDFLILLAGALALLLIGFQVYRDVVVADVWGWATVGAIAQFVLVLLIASVPVAMPAVMSVTMALGALALSKQKAIVSRLSAIEELAGVDVLCSDKTGTLTMNQLKLDAPIPYGSAKPEDVVFAAALASQRSSEDAIDVAVFQGLTDPKALDTITQTAFVPFDPVNKKTVATVTDAQGRTFHYAKGHRRRSPSSASSIRSPAASMTARSTISPATATGRWAWRAPATARPGRWWACCPCRTRRAPTPRPPSPRPRSWAWR